MKKMIMPLSYLRWKLYHQALWAKALGMGRLAETIGEVFDQFEEADCWGDPLMGSLECTLFDLMESGAFHGLSLWWLRWLHSRLPHWHVVIDEPAETPYVQFERIGKQLARLEEWYRWFRPSHEQEASDYCYAARLLLRRPSTDRWLYQTLLYQRGTFWRDLLSVTFPLPPEHPMSEDTRMVLDSLLTEGENSPYLQEA